ncbi:MAG: 2,3-bisphosphoglycerate-independent phosphoglycerate mutase, partial [Synechococcaceae bacterium WB6_3B_236]|nr:2,3-bisphosphoglycerate-independent phosphoglycerate mutase [Synechococcaceae bacterium WB6_3B_236]
GFKQVCIHAITDGRDTPTNSSLAYLAQLREAIAEAGIGSITSLCGRYWAMDRDNRWERVEKAYRLLTEAGPLSGDSPEAVLASAHQAGTSDEFLEPVRFGPEVIGANDGLVLFNFRPDRMRQLTAALVKPEFNGFERQQIKPLHVVTFTQYEKGLPVAVAFPPESLDDLLGEVISREGLRQFRTAETEKYPHVTQSPAMSADSLTDGCVAAIRKGIYSLVVINFANPDMVGHTGDMQATMEAVACVDKCVGRLLDATCAMGGSLLITADHGNAELMQGADGRPWTAHTTNPVPFILVEGEQRKLAGFGGDLQLRQGGGLADIAPTVLQLLGIEVPASMSGQSLVQPIKTESPVHSRPTLA